jgi:peptidoglycan/LPS O-acetylase OafA/YrhL
MLVKSEPTIFVSWRNPRLAGRILELDGVRGLAILLVLVYHYLYASMYPPPGSWQAAILSPLRMGWSGVDLFFVLSGFLIGGILYDAKNSGRYFQTFYLRRTHRIFPLYFAWMIVFVLGIFVARSNAAPPLQALFHSNLPLWPYFLFIQNFFMFAQSDYGAQWVAVTWSLAIEEQFYMLLPLLVRKLSYRGILGVALGSIILAPILRILLWLHSPDDPGLGGYTLLPCRADALGYGVLIALVCRNQSAWEWLTTHRRKLLWGFWFLGCGVIYLALWQPRGFFTVGASWLAAFYAMLLLLAVLKPGRVAKACFGNWPLVKLGMVAYAVYMFHQGINGLLHFAFFDRRPVIDSWPSFLVTLLSLASVLILAAVSWRFFEKPLIRYAHSSYHY